MLHIDKKPKGSEAVHMYCQSIVQSLIRADRKHDTTHENPKKDYLNEISSHIIAERAYNLKDKIEENIILLED
jgi:hypothetical protein